MAQQTINIGAAPDDDTGDPARTAFTKCNANFTELYNGREVLTAARTYYVRTDGSDSNTGLADTSGGAFLTIQKAINTAAGLDGGGYYAVSINVADGTYTGGMTLRSHINQVIIIVGNTTTPANCIISTTSNFPVIGQGVFGSYSVEGFHLKANTAGYDCVIVTQGTNISLKNILFEGTIHMHATFSAVILVNGPISVTGNFNIHAFADSHSIIQCAGRTITITGTPAIVQGWAYINQGGLFITNANTYSGSCTGPRYYVSGLSYCNTGTSGSATYFPGSVAGSVASGGIYD